jgi:hypothetical protein
MKTVAGAVSTAAIAAVSNMAHPTAMAMCAAESAMPTCAVVTIILNSTIAGAGAAASTAGSQSDLTVISAFGSIASINGQCSSSKRKARDHGGGLRISSKRRTSSGGDVSILIPHLCSTSHPAYLMH